MSSDSPPLSPELLLYAYQHGLFPMADPDEDDAIYWYAPDPRGIIPLDTFHVPKTLAKLVRQGRFRVTSDKAFEEVIGACAKREETWISEDIIQTYTNLHDVGFAHSIECWQDDTLVGGLYGVAIGGAFFGESMFHRVRDASKVALVHLVNHLTSQGFVLLDTQFITPHLARFGAIEISKANYEARLQEALYVNTKW